MTSDGTPHDRSAPPGRPAAGRLAGRTGRSTGRAALGATTREQLALATSVVALLAVLAAAPTERVLAASASAAAGSAAPSAEPGPLGGLQAWLDVAPPRDAPAGSTIPVGLTLWDPGAAQLSPLGGLYLKLHPAAGSAAPSETETRSDWPGHLLANVLVPRGGPGAIEVGLRGTACAADGTCAPADLSIPIAGTGPPPDAPRSALVSAIVHLPAVPAVAGSPFDVAVDLRPRAAWDEAAFALPDRLVVVATFGSGPDLANVEIRPDPGVRSLFHGSITIPLAGDVALAVAIPGNGGPDDVIQSATTRIKVGVRADGGSPDATPAAPASSDIPWLLVAGAVVLVVVGGFVVSRVFADL